MKWQEFIVSDPSILLGKPIIKGTRISVELILDLLENGWTPQQLIEAYPSLTPDSISAVFSYLKECISHEFYFPFSA
ncbi:MAG: DUF433 domain-containing protein [bacterium]|jgi:uncharacterized protein (DUF433 family)|nr:DUF433 domain-containing protein [Chitinophagaceae bacterium]